MYGKHLVHHWSSTQASVALSSAEAELNAMIKAGSELIGIMDMSKDYGRLLKGAMYTDSSAANGVVHRLGCGKMKHLETRQLWLQEVIEKKVMESKKIPRSENSSDALKHHWLGHEGEVHFKKMNLRAIPVADGT